VSNKTRDFKVTISERDLPVLLDMMRYENSTVINWDRGTPLSTGSRVYIITLRSDYFTPDRWSSFLIFPEVVS
jgi:hypothetical protein